MGKPWSTPEPKTFIVLAAGEMSALALGKFYFPNWNIIGTWTRQYSHWLESYWFMWDAGCLARGATHTWKLSKIRPIYPHDGHRCQKKNIHNCWRFWVRHAGLVSCFFHYWILVVHVHTQLGISTQSFMMPIISIGISKYRDALALLLLHHQLSSAWLGQRVHWSQTNDHTFVGPAFKKYSLVYE